MTIGSGVSAACDSAAWGVGVGSSTLVADRTPDAALTPVLRLENVSKTFGGFRALDGVDLSIDPGTIHGLVGENGSGKSTLIKLLSGHYIPDAGSRLKVREKDFAPSAEPGSFRRHGISFVHQDLALVPDVSVAENLMVGRLVAGRTPLINWAAEYRKAAGIFARYGLKIDPKAPVSRLNETERALVAILRAVEELGGQRSLLVLDEPTVFLPRSGTDLLFQVVHELVADGRMSVLLVSHDIREVLEHTDAVTVLRGGRVQGTAASDSITEAELGTLIVGRAVNDGRRSAPVQAGKSAALTGLSVGMVREFSCQLHHGEILGITGLAGSGVEDVLAGIYGARTADAGTLKLRGQEHALSGMTPAKALAAGIVYVPADRKVEGGALDLSVGQNVLLPRLGRFLGLLGLSQRRLDASATHLAETYDVRPRSHKAAFGTLSGGNQQKAVIGKWLEMHPDLVLLQDPTQGIDIGARAHINDLLRETAARGVPVICATSDYEQLALLCHRVIVLAHGQAVAELSGDDVSRDSISNVVIRSLAMDQSSMKESA
jgi:ribose transport system ATP-binding protein